MFRAVVPRPGDAPKFDFPEKTVVDKFTAKKWKEWPPKVRDELIAAGLAHPVDNSGGAHMHDFTGDDGHQRTRAEIDELSAKRAEAGRKGGSSHGKPQASA